MNWLESLYFRLFTKSFYIHYAVVSNNAFNTLYQVYIIDYFLYLILYCCWSKCVVTNQIYIFNIINSELFWLDFWLMYFYN